MHEVERDQEHLATGDLLRLALEQARELARAEAVHAREELMEEMKSAMLGAAFAVAALAFGTAALTAVFLAAAFALPLYPWWSALIAAGVLVLLAIIFGVIAYLRMPRKPLKLTRERLHEDIEELEHGLS